MAMAVPGVTSEGFILSAFCLFWRVEMRLMVSSDATVEVVEKFLAGSEKSMAKRGRVVYANT